MYFTRRMSFKITRPSWTADEARFFLSFVINGRWSLVDLNGSVIVSLKFSSCFVTFGKGSTTNATSRTVRLAFSHPLRFKCIICGLIVLVSPRKIWMRPWVSLSKWVPYISIIQALDIRPRAFNPSWWRICSFGQMPAIPRSFRGCCPRKSCEELLVVFLNIEEFHALPPSIVL